ncbi:antitoxin Xre/MbcA/ParS toxin-binding domain-containing protein [Ekhidna sp.]|uniref:antitoxin Xre/MbcA/ParS toxin-binding domain-containing protein n=1 Tax=Ekhidna sp. TaxID=2608089 RepID=UPI003C7A75FE
MNDSELRERLFTEGIMTFGSLDEFEKWLGTQSRDLNWKKPKDLLNTEENTQRVIDLLGRMREKA